jgi:hypothetical protein
VLGVGGDRDQRLGRGFEQDAVDHGLVLVGNIGDRRRQCEHHVIIGHGQQFALAVGEPLLGSSGLTLRTVPVAAGNGRCPLPALWANFVMVSRQAAEWPIRLTFK